MTTSVEPTQETPVDAEIQETEIRLFNTEPVRALVPGDTIEWGGGRLIRLLYTGLVRYGEDDGLARNAMAESIQTEDSKVFRIRIKPGWRFHDGTEVKAHNFVDAWNHTAYGPNKMGNNSFLAKVEGYADLNGPAPTTTRLSGLEVLGDHEFRVTLSQRASVFPTMLGYFAFYPLPDAFFADPEAFARHPIGNGPYRFVSHTPEVETRYTLFEDYRGPRPGRIRDVTFRTYTNDDEGAYEDLVAGKLDYMEGLPYEVVVSGRYTDDLGDRHVDRNFLLVQGLQFPHYLPGYDSPDLHKAVSMAIDREKIIRETMRGRQEPADGWCHSGVAGYLAGQGGEYFTYQPEKAREHFARSGFSGELVLFANTGSAAVSWMPAVCRSISETLGISCTMDRSQPYGEYLGHVVRQEMTGPYRQDWRADYPSIENFLGPLYGTGMAANHCGYSNPEFDAALAEADAAPSEELAIALYQKAERILRDDMPSVPLWQEWSVAGYSPKLENVRIDIFTDLMVSEVRVVEGG